MGERRYLVVGGAGYFGSRLAESLAKDAAVTVTQRSPSPRRSAWIERSGLRALTFDSAASPRLPVSERYDGIVNLAMPGAGEAARDPATARKSAIATARACLDLLREGLASKLIHFSSFHVYGAPGRDRYCEGDVPQPVIPYGHVHLEAERVVLEKERVVAVRPSNLVGAPAHGELGDQARLLFVDLCRQAAHGVMKLHNDGLSYRDFLPFDDAIAAVRLLLNADVEGDRLFNLARGEALRLDRVATLIREAAPADPAIEYGTAQDLFRAPFTVSVDRLSKLGWRPRAALEDEAARMVRFFQDNE